MKLQHHSCIQRASKLVKLQSLVVKHTVHTVWPCNVCTFYILLCCRSYCWSGKYSLPQSHNEETYKMCKLCSAIVPFLIIFLQPNLTILHNYFDALFSAVVSTDYKNFKTVKMSIVFLLLRTCSFGLLSDCF